jgi:hypothetical protein
MLNPESLNWRGYTGLFWGTTAIATFAWAWYRLPETKGRTYEELDLLFAQGVDARKFESTNVRALQTHEMRPVTRKAPNKAAVGERSSPEWDMVDEHDRLTIEADAVGEAADVASYRDYSARG